MQCGVRVRCFYSIQYSIVSYTLCSFILRCSQASNALLKCYRITCYAKRNANETSANYSTYIPLRTHDAYYRKSCKSCLCNANLNTSTGACPYPSAPSHRSDVRRGPDHPSEERHKTRAHAFGALGKLCTRNAQRARLRCVRSCAAHNNSNYLFDIELI